MIISMTRPCPVCQSDYRELIYSHETTMRGHQDVYACLGCGMIYSSVGTPVDYSQSIYSEPQATGSGDSPDDLKRLDETAEVIAPYLNKSAKILDVGCSQGGMLAALHKKGFTELIGIDLNHSCCDATIKRGFKAVPVGLQDIDGKFDCIIFSHVLEHVEDPAGLLRTALSKLEREGILYIEIPDASKYLDCSGRAPFLDFNSEHINHFTFYSLYCLLGECGLESWDKRKKTLTISSGIDYPAFWVVAKRRESTRKMMEIIEKSQASLQVANKNLGAALERHPECVVWGAGEYLAKIIDLSVFRKVKVCYIIDRNTSLHGKKVRGIPIYALPPLDYDLPIVIASAANSKIIHDYIRSQGITNKIIELEFA